MNDNQKKLIDLANTMEDLFKQGKYNEIMAKFDNIVKKWDLCSKFYSIYARLKYIRCKVICFSENQQQLWLQESTACLTPNFFPYIPETFFDEWLNTFYGPVHWIPKGTEFFFDSSYANGATFFKVHAYFLKPFGWEDNPIEVQVKLISTLPKEISNVSLAVQLVGNMDNNLKKEVCVFAKNQTITPNKRLTFTGEIHPESKLTDYTLSHFVLIINDILLFFDADNEQLVHEIHIEPQDSGCSLTANLMPMGFVNVPAPIYLKFVASDVADYSVFLNVSCKDASVFQNIDDSKKYIENADLPKSEMKDVRIDISEPNKDYNLTFYAFSRYPNEISIKLNWYVRKGEKDFKVTTQELPIEFQLPFIIQTSIFNEAHNLLTNNDSLLTESKYTMLMKFTSNSSLSATIESFDIIPTTNNIQFTKPMIKLPISVNQNDKFSAFTTFTTGENEEKTNLGKIQIKYLIMNSALYSGSHLYTVNLPSNDNQISIEKLKLRVKFVFPPRGSQFEMCELSLNITNISDTPIEIVLSIQNSRDFFISGTTNTQLGLFPDDPVEYPLTFFPLAHGTLQFPLISINSAQDYSICYWKSSPPIFISYPSSS